MITVYIRLKLYVPNIIILCQPRRLWQPNVGVVTFEVRRVNIARCQIQRFLFCLSKPFAHTTWGLVRIQPTHGY